MSQRALAWRAERMVESEAMASGFRALVPASVENPPAKAKRLYTSYLGLTSVFQASASARASTQAFCASHDVTCLELSVLQLTSIVQDTADEPSFSRPYIRVCERLEGAGEPAARVQGRASPSRSSSTMAPGNSGGSRPPTLEITRTTLESVGTPAPWIDVEIVDADGKALPTGEVGELRVRSECMTHQYYGDPVATSRHFRNGWFYPGDLASLTSGGALCLHGRADDMMTLNSIKIFPAEIERVLEEHPGVKAAAAFAKASNTHGDIPVAAVELHAAAGIGSDELMARARERLGVRAPRRIIVVDALPRNAAGKILKHELDRSDRDGPVSERPMADSRRLAVFEALKIAAPSAFNDEMRKDIPDHGIECRFRGARHGQSG